MNNASIGIMFHARARIGRANAGFAEMFGYGEGECEGLPVRTCTPTTRPSSASARGLSACWARANLPGRAHAGAQGRHADLGQPDRLPGQSGRPGPGHHRLDDRGPQRARSRDEESLRNALLENQAILDNAVLGIAVVENGRTLHCNRKMEELFGYPGAGMDGASVRALYPDADGWQAARLDPARDFAAGRVTWPNA
jgi:hypothetical protein